MVRHMGCCRPGTRLTQWSVPELELVKAGRLRVNYSNYWWAWDWFFFKPAMLYQPLAEELIWHWSHIGGVYSAWPYLSLVYIKGDFRTGCWKWSIPNQNGLFQNHQVRQWRVLSSLYHCWIENGKPARSESCDRRGRPCFTQVFWSKTIQLQQTFPGSFRLPSSQFSSVVLICARKARKTRWSGF